MIIKENRFIEDTKGAELYELKFRIENIRKMFHEDKSIFISHKHGEVQNVFRLREILSRYGFQGYVDWEDDTMPIETSGETAMKIKEKIKNGRKFILIATNAAIESKWCNWEIGFADAHKYSEHIAIMPLESSYSSFKGGEYLQIYPSIQINDNNSNNPIYYVHCPDGTKKDFSEWLKK